jgi:hypothetical protein
VKRLVAVLVIVPALFAALAVSASALSAPQLSVVSTTVGPSPYSGRYDQVTTKLQWTSVPDAASYKLCYSRPSLHLGCYLGIKTTTYTVTQNVLKGGSYDFWVEACGAGGKTCVASNKVTATAP